ncbi:hypothetical protein WKH02_21490 [Pantoea agglomerans]|uniref:hypothetical protein n=1 Tax=Enterobacter agglomerans TaxID=549 RepID=UPI003C7B93FB
MKTTVNAAEILEKIGESKGTNYLNRTHQRSFSYNIFQMNALELIEAAYRVKDPDQGFLLMMENNREAGLQAHRELNRHVHNFVSSSLTLVEHTRVFMRKHYVDTQLYKTYEKQVIATFANSPVAQFVQGLRNYMLHKGLPNSNMYLRFESNPGATNGSGTMETGVHYDTASLLDWKDWKPVARNYIELSGENLDIHEFTLEYLTLVNQFHGWLNATLEMHHRSDLQELNHLQAQFNDIHSINVQIAPSEQSDLINEEPFIFTSDLSIELDQISLELMNKIQELHFKHNSQDFPTERPTTPITDKELIGSVTFWGEDTNGRPAFSFFQHDGKPYGLVGEDYEYLDNLIDTAMKSEWTRTSLSRDFVEMTFFDWVRQQFPAVQVSFSVILRDVAREKVTTVEVWAPIANMEVEKGFNFGPIRIESLTAAKMGNLRSKLPSPPPEQEQQFDQYFEKLRQDFQGYAVAIVSTEAEPKFALERAFQIAQDAMGLLTFFSPAALSIYIFNPVALSGAEYIPTSKLMTIHEDGFSHNERILPTKVGYWRLSAERISELNSDLLEAAGSLVMPEGLSEFALAVRTSILIYSKGLTLLASKERLRSCLSALEFILLKHDMEPRAHSIANRMSIILSVLSIDSDDVKKTIQRIYWLLEQPQRTEYGHRENEFIASFITYAYNALHVALNNIHTFRHKAQFVTEVDRMGISR